jgi:Peptidase S46
MKRIDFYYFLTLGLLMFALGQLPIPQPKHGMQKSVVTQKEQKTQHAIWLKDDRDRDEGLCTGTAIGPHAVMFATHCLESKPKEVSIDLATETHEILNSVDDGRDHSILLLDGTPFKNIEIVTPGIAVIGQTVTLYGDGGAAYPPVPKYGTVIDCEDPSDMDAAAGQFCSTIHAIPGDSGSAVFNTKGEIVGITTYLEEGTYPTGSRDFALNFTPKQLNDAATFDGIEKDSPKPAFKLTTEDDIFGRIFGH